MIEKHSLRGKGNSLAVRRIASGADIAAGVAALTRACPAMAKAHALTGYPPLRRWSEGFPGLVRIVAGQQLSTASAAAIHGRLIARIDPLTPEALASTPDEVLRACGLSTGKIATLRGLTDLDYALLGSLDAGTLRETLLARRGIGPWTADIYLMFCRGEADAFAPGDLALQIGVQMLFEREDRPSAAETNDIAERWRPWRGVAARLIWAYYGAVKAGGRQKTTAAIRPTPRPKARRTPPARGGTNSG